MACWERVVGEFGNSQTSSAARVDDLAVDGGCEVDDDADDDVDTVAHAAVDVDDDAVMMQMVVWMQMWMMLLMMAMRLMVASETLLTQQ